MRILSLRRSSVPVIAVALLAGLLLFVGSPPASAHDALASSSPEADSTVDVLPSVLTLTFNAAPIDGEGATLVEVTDASGASVTDGEPTLNGSVVTQPLVAEADAGVYHVIWKVVSSDGHPTSEEFSFTVSTSTVSENGTPSAEPTETAAPTETVTPEPTTVPAEDPNMTAGTSISVPWIVGGAAVALIALSLGVALYRRRRQSGAASDSDASADR